MHFLSCRSFMMRNCTGKQTYFQLLLKGFELQVSWLANIVVRSSSSLGRIFCVWDADFFSLCSFGNTFVKYSVDTKSYYLRIIEWCELEETFEDHLVPTPSAMWIFTDEWKVTSSRKLTDSWCKCLGSAGSCSTLSSAPWYHLFQYSKWC